MSPFFDQPGSNAGPYSTPAQPGILSRILAGVNVAMKLGDFYQDWQSKTQARENAGIEGIVNRVKLAQTLNPGAPTSLEGGLGADIEKTARIKLPRVTPETQTGMAGSLMQRTSAMPVTESRPGLTTPGDPGVAERNAAMTQGMATIPQVGGFAPIMPAETEAQIKAKLLRQSTPEQQRKMLYPKTEQNPIINSKGVIVGYTAGRPFQLKAGEDEQFAQWQKKENIKYSNQVGLEGVRQNNRIGMAGVQSNLQDTAPRNQNYEIDNEGNIRRLGPGKFKNAKEDTAKKPLTQSQKASLKARAMGQARKEVELSLGVTDTFKPEHETQVESRAEELYSQWTSEGSTKASGKGNTDYFDSFKKALSGPNKDAAIKRSRELGDGYFDRAKKEGLL